MAKSGYDDIASEYYDSEHVTSRNFDNTTRAALAASPFPVPNGLMLELGAGRGRAQEFLGANAEQVVQLDSAPTMFELPNREACLLQVLADACDIPLSPQQFSSVVGFLVDPFMGLSSLGEAFRMLMNDGRLLLSVPAYEWGTALRARLGIDVMTTRFRQLSTGKTITLPSLLHPKDQLREMLGLSGFRDIYIRDCMLPVSETRISDDITSLGIDFTKVPLLYLITATR
jgi:ubiquinone/menaquinone biosynthesis C-methylase UbiE